MSSRLVQPNSKGNKHAHSVDTLRDAERIFCAEFIANRGNASAAAKVAYPATKHPGTMSSMLLHRPRVKLYLGKLLGNHLKAKGLTTARLLEHLETALFLDPLDFFEPTAVDGVFTIRSLDDIPASVRQCVTKIKSMTRVTDDGDTQTYLQLEFISKDKALELAMKYAGLLKESGLDAQKGGVTINFYSLAEGPVVGVGDGSSDVVEGDVIESRLLSEEALPEALAE